LQFQAEMKHLKSRFKVTANLGQTILKMGVDKTVICIIMKL